MWSIMCISAFLEQIFRIARQNWSFIMDYRHQQDTAVQAKLLGENMQLSIISMDLLNWLCYFLEV